MPDRPTKYNPIKPELAERVRALRKQGLTYVQICQRTGLNSSTVGRICRGESHLSQADGTFQRSRLPVTTGPSDADAKASAERLKALLEPEEDDTPE